MTSVPLLVSFCAARKDSPPKHSFPFHRFWNSESGIWLVALPRCVEALLTLEDT